MASGSFEMIPTVTNAYISAFASTFGVILLDKDGNPLVNANDAIMHWPGGGEVKDFEVFSQYVYEQCKANSGNMPSRYDEGTTEGHLPRHLLCVGTACE